jgi:dTDP-4-dehydrorhamnose reductase
MRGSRILITGAKGMLGTSLMQFLNYKDKIGYSREALDVTNFREVYRILKQNSPDIIIHTACMTDVEQCEKFPIAAYKTNVIGTQNLVNYCINKNILFIYISSTGVYGRTKDEPYTEFDTAFPTTVHHDSKYEAEMIIKHHLSKYIILRVGWLFGGDLSHKKNFVYKIYLETSKAKTIYANSTQTGNPTSTKNVSNQLQTLIENNLYGTFNCVDHSIGVSRFEYIKKIVNLFNIDCNVMPTDDAFFDRMAKVSHNESAINYKLQLLGLDVMQNWQVSLEAYISKLKEKI